MEATACVSYNQLQQTNKATNNKLLKELTSKTSQENQRVSSPLIVNSRLRNFRGTVGRVMVHGPAVEKDKVR